MSAKIKVEKIKIDGGTQPRCEINESAVTEYSEAIGAGITLPPVVVYFDGTAYWLADGFHRFLAHMKLDRKEIECEVMRGTRRDAILHSVGANVTHGLRRTNADKRKAAGTLLTDEEWGAWSNEKIANACCIGPHLVADVRGCLSLRTQRCADEPEAPRKFERGGKVHVMKTENIGKKTPKPVETKDSPLCDQVSKEAPEIITDDYDQIIPEHLLPAFDNSDTIIVLARGVASLKGNVQAAAQAPGGELLSANTSEIERLRKDLYGLLVDNRPTAVCGMCHGDKKNMKGCKACKGRGWLPDHVYKKLPEANRKGGKNAPAAVSAGGR